MAQRTVLAANKIVFKRSCYCIVIIFLYHQLSVCYAAEVTEPTAAANTTDAESNATFLEPIAEQLVRFRRQPPRTIVKHIIRPKRVKVKRFKRPKIKYSFAEPPSIYYRKSNSKPVPAIYSGHHAAPHAPTFDSSIFEDFSHLNVESADFDLPPSSYEGHSMDLDLYKNYESAAETLYKEEEKPSSYSHTAEEEVSYKETYAAPPSKAERTPHAEYGVPTEFVYSSGYDKPSGGGLGYSYEEESHDKPSSGGHGYSYEPPAHDEPSKSPVEKPSLSYPSSGHSYSYEEQEVHDKPSSGGHGYSYQPPSHEQPSKPSSSGYDHPSSGHSYSYEEQEVHGKPSSGGHGYSYQPPPHEQPSKPSSSGYDHPSSGHSYSYEEASSGYSYHEPEEHSKPVEKPSSSYSGGYSYQPPSKTAHKPSSSYSRPYSKPKPHPPPPPPRIPATKYGVPDLHIPLPNYGDYNKYSLIEHKAPTSYENFESVNQNKHHFAEPPDVHQDPSVKITYSPSYEINIPAADEHQHHDFESVPPQQYDQAPPSKHHPSHGYQESSDTHQPPKYEPAPHQDLPINHNHRHPNYDYPKSSYEVPIYDPIPFDSSTNQQQEVYPPQPFDNASWKEASQTDYTAEPNNVSEQKPSQDMDSQSESNERPHEDTHSAGTRPHGQSAADVTAATRPRRTHKRKRTKGTSAMPVATTKHILDVPELEEAFEKEKRHNNQQQTSDADINESHKIKVKINNGPWNPMRIRTPALSAATTPATTLAMNHQNQNLQQQHHQQPSVSRNPYQYRLRTTTTTTQSPPPPPAPTAPPQPQPHPHHHPHHHQSTNHIPNVEIVSIEKSRSKTYYDGILSTPKIYNTNFYRNRYKTAEPSQVTSTVLPHASVSAASRERFAKRTTKNVFDTTIFKSPLTDRDIYRNLPKNHKLF